VKPSLCIDGRWLFSSGIGRALREILPEIEHAFSITLLVQDAPLFEEIQTKKIVMNRHCFSFKEQYAFAHTIPPCDLFWSVHYNIPLRSIRARKRIVTIHDLCPLACPEAFPWYKRLGAHMFLKQAIQRSDLIMTVSKFSKQELYTYLPVRDKNVQVVLHGEPRLRKPLKEVAKPFILYVGNLKVHKNIRRLMQIVKRLSIPCVFVGCLFDKTCYERHPRLHFVGEVNDEQLAWLYRHALMLVQPSLYEGFGMTTLEAMQMGCPVVASSIPSLIETCADAAYFVDPYDEEAIYQGIQRVHQDLSLREQLIHAGYLRAQQFSWKRAGEETVKHFMRLLA